MLKTVVTSDIEVRKRIKNGLQQTGGYCPCELEHTIDTRCMCKAFRELDKPGTCHCGLFKKVEV